MVTDEPESRERRQANDVRELADVPIDAADLVDLGQVLRPPAGGPGKRSFGTLAVGATIVVLIAGILFANRPDLATTVTTPVPSASGSLGIASPTPARTGPRRMAIGCSS